MSSIFSACIFTAIFGSTRANDVGTYGASSAGTFIIVLIFVGIIYYYCRYKMETSNNFAILTNEDDETGNQTEPETRRRKFFRRQKRGNARRQQNHQYRPTSPPPPPTQVIIQPVIHVASRNPTNLEQQFDPNSGGIFEPCLGTLPAGSVPDVKHGGPPVPEAPPAYQESNYFGKNFFNGGNNQHPKSLGQLAEPRGGCDIWNRY